MITFLYYLLLVLLLLRPQEVLPAMAGVPVVQVSMLAALTTWLFSRDKGLELPQFRLLLLLVLFMCLGVGVNGWLGGMPGVVTELAPSIAVFLVAAVAARSIRAFDVTAWLLVACSALLVWHSAVQMAVGIGPISNIKPVDGRPYYAGTLADPNDLGQMFAISLALATYLLGRQQGWLNRLLVLAAIGWLGYGIILTDSRGALLSALAVVGIAGMQRFGKVTVLVGAGLSVPVLLTATRLGQLNPDEESAAGRVEAWYEGFQMLRQHPLFGVGYRNFTDHYYLTAHNFLVLAMAELGLIGFTLWLGLIWYTVRMTWWVAYGPHGDRPAELAPAAREELQAGRAMMLALLAFGISSFFLSQSFKFQIFLLMGLAVARFIAASRVLPEPPTYQLAGDIPKIVRNALIAIVVMYLVVRVLL